jgi:Sulfotransferase domain
VAEAGVKRVAMWSGPRNISTALMRAFENRDDTTVVDEPLYGYYLQQTGFDHPAGDDIMAAMECDWRAVVDELCHGTAGGASVYYQKHMTQHLLPQVELAFTENLHNCFLIRDPRRIIASYAKVRPDFTLEELGLPQQWELFQRVAQRNGEAPLVIDAAQTLRDPENTLRALCQRLGIGFSERMLHWPAGRRDSDGVWAPHWYGAVEASTGWAEPADETEVVIPERYEACCEQAQGYYAELYDYALVRT